MVTSSLEKNKAGRRGREDGGWSGFLRSRLGSRTCWGLMGVFQGLVSSDCHLPLGQWGQWWPPAWEGVAVKWTLATLQTKGEISEPWNNDCGPLPYPRPVLNIEQSSVVPTNLKYEMQMPLKIGKYIFERASIWSPVKWSLHCFLAPASRTEPWVMSSLYSSSMSRTHLLNLCSHCKHSLWRPTGNSKSWVCFPALLLAVCVTLGKCLYLSKLPICSYSYLKEIKWVDVRAQ